MRFVTLDPIFFSNMMLQKKMFNRFRSSRTEVFCKKGVLRNFAKFTGKHLGKGLFSKKVADCLKKTLTQVFSCEFREISKTFSYRTPPVAASSNSGFKLLY